MAKRQSVAKFGQLAARVLRRIGIRHSVMKMYLNLSPSGVTVRSEGFEHAFIILLSRIKVTVRKRASIVVTEGIDDFGVFARPCFQAPFLLDARGVLLAIPGNDRWFEMIRQRKYDMRGTMAHRSQSLPHRNGKNFFGVDELFF
jgi:hypothetical protein